MSKSKSVFSGKRFRKTLKRHPYSAAAALIALGGVAVMKSDKLRTLKERAMRGVSSARDAARDALDSDAESPAARQH